MNTYEIMIRACFSSSCAFSCVTLVYVTTFLVAAKYSSECMSQSLLTSLAGLTEHVEVGEVFSLGMKSVALTSKA